MKCPYCQDAEDRVVDSRETREGTVIRRRRECQGCSRRFTSYERIHLQKRRNHTADFRTMINIDRPPILPFDHHL